MGERVPDPYRMAGAYYTLTGHHLKLHDDFHDFVHVAEIGTQQDFGKERFGFFRIFLQYAGEGNQPGRTF